MVVQSRKAAQLNPVNLELKVRQISTITEAIGNEHPFLWDLIFINYMQH